MTTPFQFLCRWPLAEQSAPGARRVSCLLIPECNERGLQNRRSLVAADSIPAPCGVGSARTVCSRSALPLGRLRQQKDRLNPVRAVSAAARATVNTRS